MAEKTRPTKKQHELLAFLREYIQQRGYSPTYREIMRGCNYTSVATVALHINNLIKRGHVVKRDKSARSLEVVEGLTESPQAKSNHKHEIIEEVEARLSTLEKEVKQDIVDEVFVLVGALKILGHSEVARAYATRLNEFM